MSEWQELPTDGIAVVSSWSPPITGESVTLRFTPACEHSTELARVLWRDVFALGELPRVEHRVECRECGALYKTDAVLS